MSRIARNPSPKMIEEEVSSDVESSSAEGKTDGESAEAPVHTPRIEVKAVAKGPIPIDRTTRRRGCIKIDNV